MKLSRSRLGLGAGLAGGLLGLALVSGVGPAPALSGISSGGSDDGTTSTTGATVPDDRPSTSRAAAEAAGRRVVDAGGAGTITVTEEGDTLRLLVAEPAPGWTVEVEESSGREVEVDFRRGTERVQVDVEIEDGAVRERVRFRDAATGADLLVEDGRVISDDATDDRGGDADDGRGDDRGGRGADDGHHDDHGDDRGGRGADDGHHDDHGDDRDGHRSDDGHGDDRGDDD